MEELRERLTEVLRRSSNIVFFGGAGVSTASNIPDFRSANGLFHQKLHRTLSPEEMVSRTFYERYPEDFFDFYRQHLVYPQAQPNDCHKALAKLEQMGKLKAVVTQNIDGLHQKAGSKTVYELHGSVLRNFCTRCHKFYGVDAILETDGVPRCECGGVIKPDVVLYEESLDDNVINGAVRAIATADTLIVGGTSLIVYPAAGLIHYYRGRDLILINKSVTSADSEASLVLHEDIASVMKEVTDALCGEA
ncbi:MAG: NAD-dependent protein deacylase [Lachnospiraceae bacterium]|nr:NAD-dependent protein deacylase [Lachnospiraceae bacterium]